MNLTILNFAFLLTFSGSVSQPCSLLLQPLTWGTNAASCQRTITCFALDQSSILCVCLFLTLIVTTALLCCFLTQHLLAILLLLWCFRPRELVRLPLPERSDRMSWWRKQSPSHISAPRNKTGAVVAWAFLWQSYQLMQSSPRFTLYYFGIYVVLQCESHQGGWPSRELT